MKSHHHHPVPSTAGHPSYSFHPSRSFPPAALRTSYERIVAFYFDSLLMAAQAPGRRLHQEAAQAARRGDPCARDFLAGLEYEQAA